MSRQFFIQGHRGARGHYPENTVVGFKKAVDLGADTLELDVVVCSDRQLVVSHEAWMNDEICSLPDGTPIKKGRGKEYNLFQMTYEQIKKFDCGKRGHPEFPHQVAIPAYKPLLGEVITALESYIREKQIASVNYNIEIKMEEKDGEFNPPPAEYAELVCKEISKYSIKGQFALQSFNVRVLQQVRKINALQTIGLLVENQDGLNYSLQKLGFNPAFYCPEFTLVSKELIHEVHIRGMKLAAWTVNHKSDMQRLLLMGVDGLISDYPDRLADAVRNTNPA